MRYFMSLIGLLFLFACNGGSNDDSASSLALADDKEAMIANAESAAPDSVTANATIKAPDNFRLSYMLAGEGSAIGNSNSDP